MEKKNTMLLTIIAVATLLVAVVGATFAYFTAQNGASGSTTATVTTETIGAITVSNEDPALYLDLTAAQMQEGATGSYWATKIKGAEPATNYASADKAVIAKLNVSGGDETTTYSCNFKITVDKTDVTLAYGDAAVVFALENNAEILGVTSGREIDYTTLLNEYTVNFTRVGDTEEDLPLVSVSMRVSNTEVEQGFAGETLTTAFTSSDLECEIVDATKLSAPTITLNDNILNIIPTDERTEEYEIYVDGVLQTTISADVSQEANKLSGTWKLNDVLTVVPYDTFKMGYYTTSHEPMINNHGVDIVPIEDSGVTLYRFSLANTYGDMYDNGEPSTFYESIVLYVNYGGTMTYVFGDVEMLASQTFTINGEQEVSTDFYEWLTTNATKITTYDLSSLNLQNGIYDITIKAKANGYENSEFSNETEFSVGSILSGTWQFNDVLTRPSAEYTQNINFVAENINFETILITFEAEAYMSFYFYDGVQNHVTNVYDGGWKEQTYRIVTFNSTQEVSDEFYNWFTANATKVN